MEARLARTFGWLGRSVGLAIAGLEARRRGWRWAGVSSQRQKQPDGGLLRSVRVSQCAPLHVCSEKRCLHAVFQFPDHHRFGNRLHTSSIDDVINANSKRETPMQNLTTKLPLSLPFPLCPVTLLSRIPFREEGRSPTSWSVLHNPMARLARQISTEATKAPPGW